MKQQKEISTTGDVAGYDGRLSAPGNPTPAEIRKRKKEKRKLLDKGKKKKAAPFVKGEEKNIDERAHQMLRDTIFDILLEELGSNQISELNLNLLLLGNKDLIWLCL